MSSKSVPNPVHISKLSHMFIGATKLVEDPINFIKPAVKFLFGVRLIVVEYIENIVHNEVTMVRVEISFDTIHALRYTADNDSGQLALEITKRPNIAVGNAVYEGSLNSARPTKWRQFQQEEPQVAHFFTGRLYVFSFTAGVQLKNAMKKFRDVESRLDDLLLMPLCVTDEELSVLGRGEVPDTATSKMQLAPTSDASSMDDNTDSLHGSDSGKSSDTSSKKSAKKRKADLTAPVGPNGKKTNGKSVASVYIRGVSAKSKNIQAYRQALISLKQYDLHELAAQDACFLDNIIKVSDISGYLSAQVHTPCCDSVFTLQECIGNPISCRCGDTLRYSFCKGEFCSENKRPRNHCSLCGTCADSQDEHCHLCNRCYYSNRGSFACPSCRSGMGFDIEQNEGFLLSPVLASVMMSEGSLVADSPADYSRSYSGSRAQAQWSGSGASGIGHPDNDPLPACTSLAEIDLETSGLLSAF